MTARIPRPASRILLVDAAGRTLLFRFTVEGRAPFWVTPGGALDPGEPYEAAARRELLEETGLHAERLVLAANVDSITRDGAGRVQYHYTILDFAAAWTGGEPHAGGDVTDAAWAPLDGLEPFKLWSEAHRVIACAQKVLAP